VNQRDAQRRASGGLRGIAKPPYLFHATLPNEGILMVEALERRPWWKKAEKVRETQLLGPVPAAGDARAAGRVAYSPVPPRMQ
jgi:hypothetical protein